MFKRLMRKPKYFIDRMEVLYDEFLVWGWTCIEDGKGSYKTCDIEVLTDAKAVKSKANVTRMYRKDVDTHLGVAEETYKWGFMAKWSLDDMENVILSFCADKKKVEFRVSKELQEAYERELDRNYTSEEEWRTSDDEVLKQDEHIFETELDKDLLDKVHQKRLEKTVYLISYNRWRKRYILEAEELENQKNTEFDYQPKISIVVPAYRTPKKFLGEMIDSVRNQTYKNWELCIADASMDDSIVHELERYHEMDERIVYSVLDDNYGISGNTNEAIKIATGDYISLLDHDDLLTPDALYEVVKRINETGADVLYTDEDKVSFELDYYFEPHFKPDFNLDYLRSCNYICHFFIVKKDVLDQVGEFDPECDGSQDYDFILRCTSVAKRVEHIAKCVYNWRCHPNSTAMNPESKLYCYTAGRRALEKHLEAMGVKNAKAENADNYGFYRAIYEVTGNPKVSVLVVNGTNFQCAYENVEVIPVQVEWNELEEKLPAYIKEANGDYVFVSFGDAECKSQYGLELLVANMQREDVEAVGCKVLDKFENVVECGRITALAGEERMMFRGLSKEFIGYNGRGIAQQELSSIGIDGLMLRKEYAENIYNKDEYRKEKGKIVMCPYVQVQKMEQYVDALSHEDVDVVEDVFYNSNFDREKLLFTW